MTMTESSPPNDLTPKHVRAARALLAWSQQDLAKAAGVGTSTIADFERGSRTPVANNAQAIRTALETAGVSFLQGGATLGTVAPVFTPTVKQGAPVRWVTAQDLAEWGDRIDAAVSLPSLIARLVQASLDPTLTLRFPSDEGVRHPGWDGVTSSATGGGYIPKGRTGWELGVQRRNIQQKADEDYTKRTNDPDTLDPATDTFVFVTLRHWPQKDAWARARRAEGRWRDVRAYDADDLVHWIEQHPAVGLWIATRLNRRPPGALELESVWEEWSLATTWPLNEDLVLADRSEDAAEVLRWLRGAPSILALQATTSEEVVAFVHATLAELPAEIAATYQHRALVATTPEAARALVHAPAPLILLLTEPEPGLAQALVAQGHFVLLAYDERLIGRGEVRTLARPSRESIAAALEAAGMAEPRARALARDSARNLAALRRLIPSAPGRLPLWAETAPSAALLAALLAGGWDENSEGDRARLADLADQPYDTVVAALSPWLRAVDSPVQKVGSAWRVASPSDAWFLLAHHITPAMLKRFETVVEAVLGATDPRFDLDADERWMADVRGIRPIYSGLLRHGVGQVLILLALWGDQIVSVSDAPRRAHHIVAELLDGADARRWWSLSHDFRLLAEASPDAFLGAVEDSLDQNDPPIAALFSHDDDGFFGTEHLSDLMWALEALAWSPDWMPRVTHVLARLHALDVTPRKYVNGPMNSLRAIHLLWLPQTYATLEQRMRALDLVRKRQPEAAWTLMLRILPTGHDIGSNSPQPRWRDFTVDRPETVTWPLIAQGAAKIAERLVEDAGHDARRWAKLLKRLGDLTPSPTQALAVFEAAEPKIVSQDDRTYLWGKLRRLLHHHREFPDADWSLEPAVLDRLDTVYDRLAPADPLARSAWLFEDGVAMPKPTVEGWEAEQRQVDAARIAAAKSLFDAGGVQAVLALAQQIETGGYIGKALYDAALPGKDLESVLEAAARSEDPRERNVAHGLIISMFRDRKEPWAAALLARARGEAWGEAALMTILRGLPASRWTWDQVSALSEDLQTQYWRRAPVLWMDEDVDAVAYAIRRLIDVGRARHALALAGRRNKGVKLPSALLVEALDQAAKQPFEETGDSNESTMFQHYVAEILTELDGREDVDRGALALLEWNYLQVLEYSRRPAKVLLSVLAEDPRLFIQMLSSVFKASEDSEVVELEATDPAQARAVASQAYRLLSLWNHIPGRRDDGSIDGTVLEDWIKSARSLAKAAGRADIADSKIGEMLSASPPGLDGHWPAEPVRDALDLFRSKPMLEGFRVGKANRRGVTTRMPDDGGEQERALAAQYRAWATAIRFDHPYTAKALDELAENYEWHARREDEDAERRGWSY